MRCSTCDRVRPPKDPPKVGLPRADQFNQVVGLDLFYLGDCRNNTRMVLSMVDHATSYHQLRLINHRSPSEVAAAFQEAWIGTFGPPSRVIYDHGSEFLKEFETLLEQVSTLATVTPVECHWQGGLVERHGATVKTIMRKLVDVHSIADVDSFRCALQEAASCKNSLSRRNGFSPLQWVFGYDNALPGSVLDRPGDLAVHDHVHSGGNSFAVRLNIRETARLTWMQLDNSNRIRRAILTRPRQQKETFLPGETVYFYHLQLSGRPNQSRNSHPQSWHGPAIVVAPQGPGVMWVSWRRTLMKIPVENLRAATEEEVLGHQMVQEHLGDHLKDLSGQGTKTRGYIDLSNAAPPILDQNQTPLAPGAQVTTEEVPAVGRIRCLRKRPPPAGFYDEPPLQIPRTGEAEQNAAPATMQEEGDDPGIPVDHQDPETIPEEEMQPSSDLQHMENQDTSLDPPGPSPQPYEDMSCEEGEPTLILPVADKPTTDGPYHETPGYDLPYAPVKHWKDHLNERAAARNAVGAQRADRSSKFCKLLKRHRPPRAKDVLVAEVLYLRDLEASLVSDPAVYQQHLHFQEQACKGCSCLHKRVSFLVGVDEPLSRDQIPTKGGGKTSKEWKLKDMTSNQREEFQKAMNKEWKSFLDLGAVRIVKGRDAKQIPRNRILPTRFVLTNKDDTGTTLIAKARLVCGGHLDPDIDVLRTDAPTADSIGVNLIFLFAASKKWVLQAGDISTAFLSGVYDYRALYLRPPREGLQGVAADDLLEMQKGVYGLANAPRLWWRQLRSVLALSNWDSKR